jgi:hypothetical protein
MRLSSRVLVGFLLCAALSLVVWSAAASAEESPALVGSSSVFSGSFVIAGSPEEAAQLQAEREAVLASPEAVRARAESQSAYEGLSPSSAESLANEAFKGVVGERDGGPPRLPEGDQIVGFPSDFAASLALPAGKHGVVESGTPMAVDTSSGRIAVDLTPRLAGSGFEANVPAGGVHVRVGGRLSEGASLSDLGVTLTPVTEGGTPLEAGGVIDGASVFYGDSENSQAGVIDTDSLIKLKTDGFSEETVLRSERAPSKLFFEVGLPAGASLSQEASGAAVVVDGGRPIAAIAAPSARDAEGTVVPVSMSVQGDILTLTVEHVAGQYRSRSWSIRRYLKARVWVSIRWGVAGNSMRTVPKTCSRITNPHMVCTAWKITIRMADIIKRVNSVCLGMKRGVNRGSMSSYRNRVTTIRRRSRALCISVVLVAWKALFTLPNGPPPPCALSKGARPRSAIRLTGLTVLFTSRVLWQKNGRPSKIC